MIEYIILRYVIWKKFFTAWKIGQIILHQWIWVSYIIHRAWHCYTKIFFSTILVQTWKIHANFFVAYFEYLIFCKTTLGNSHKSIWIWIWSLTHFCLLSIILIQINQSEKAFRPFKRSPSLNWHNVCSIDTVKSLFVPAL